jgi:hypothetical protein
MTVPAPQQILDLALPANDAEATTVRGYLVALLTELWREEAGFSGKRPFGNSGWQYEVYAGLVRAGVVRGAFDEYGYVEDCDTAAADVLIQAAIKALGESR